MTKPSKTAATLIILGISVVAIIGIKTYIDNSRGTPVAAASARVKGPANAPAQIVEYIDFQCPACTYGAKYLSEFAKKYPSIVRLEMKYFPLTMHRHAFAAAQYAECAARQDKFWAVHDGLVNRQEQWKDLTDAKPAFEEIAKDAGLNSQKLQRCLADESILEHIKNDKGEGKTLGVQSTPTYFINGEMFVGPQSLITQLNKFLKGEDN